MPSWKGIVGRGFTQDTFTQYVASLTLSAWRPQFVVVHNTSVPRLVDWHQTPGDRRMLNLEHFYRDVQQWSAGPHLFIADDLIWAFTPLTTSGVHSPSWNAISWGMEMVGDYETEAFQDPLRANAVHALKTLHEWVGLNPDTIHFHKEDPKTTHRTCPGRNVDKADLIARVQAAMEQGEHTVADAPVAAPAA